jgi:hypothetical protein
MTTLNGLHRRKLATWAQIAATRTLAAALAAAPAAASLLAAIAIEGCGGDDTAAPEAGPADAEPPAVDLCDAFSGVGTACPTAGPLVCFPMCDSGGCFCKSTPDGPRWGCVTDTSCQPACAPIDDACAVPATATGSE